MRIIPADLLATILLASSTLIFTLVPLLSSLPIRIPLGILMVLFLPGYALIAALFPHKDDMDGIERVALSFGLSIAVVPLIGLGLNYTPWGIRLTPVVISLALFTIILALVAHLRRAQLSPEERFSVPFKHGLISLKQELIWEQRGGIDKVLVILMIISIIASLSVLVYIVANPKPGDAFTEFYILGPGKMASDYPTKVMAGETSTVMVGIVNHEYCPINYTLYMVLSNSTLVEREVTLDHNQTWEQPVNYVLEDIGDNQKLEFLLYREDNFTYPYRDLHLWVNVTE